MINSKCKFTLSNTPPQATYTKQPKPETPAVRFQALCAAGALVVKLIDQEKDIYNDILFVIETMAFSNTIR